MDHLVWDVDAHWMDFRRKTELLYDAAIRRELVTLLEGQNEEGGVADRAFSTLKILVEAQSSEPAPPGSVVLSTDQTTAGRDPTY